MKVGFLHSIIRKEEKLLLDEFRSRPGVEVIDIDDREQVFNLHKNVYDLDVVIERCVNHSRAIHSIKIFEDFVRFPYEAAVGLRHAHRPGS